MNQAWSHLTGNRHLDTIYYEVANDTHNCALVVMYQIS